MYLFYVDETGNLDTEITQTKPDGTKVDKDWVYVLTAIGFFEHKWRKFYHPITSLKRRLIGEIRTRTGRSLELSECEVKSNWIRIPSERASKPFLGNLTAQELQSLVEIYYTQLLSIPTVLISVVIDKRHLQNYMDRAKLHRKAWELLCERIDHYMREHHPKHRAVLITDDVSRQANGSLAAKHAYFLECGTSSGCWFKQIIEMPFFVRSELSEGVQTADLCSYNIYHVFKHNKKDYPFFQKIYPLLYNSANTDAQKIDGLKIFPDESPLVEWWREVARTKTKKPA